MSSPQKHLNHVVITKVTPTAQGVECDTPGWLTHIMPEIHIYWLSVCLSPWSRLLLVSQLVKKSENFTEPDDTILFFLSNLILFLSATGRFRKWPVSFRCPYQNAVYICLLPICATCRARLIIPVFITRIIFLMSANHEAPDWITFCTPLLLPSSLSVPISPPAPCSRTPLALSLPLHDRLKVTVNCLTVCLMTYSDAI